MGFLQHDTNNIILDAVLTDTGRQYLAKNDGSFDIVKFAVADDEVNYNIIRQFGRTLGKEKIEKNTPVFEAQTNGNLALKYRCISVSNPNLLRLPRVELTGEGIDSTSTIVSMGRITNKTRRLSISQTLQNENEIDTELRDQVFIITLDSQFLEIAGQSADDIDFQRRAMYLLTRDASETALGGSQLTFTLQVKALTNAQFTIFGQRSNKNIIKTFVKISGVQSGAVKEFEVQITKTS
jgi:hypothetical protein